MSDASGTIWITYTTSGILPGLYETYFTHTKSSATGTIMGQNLMTVSLEILADGSFIIEITKCVHLPIAETGCSLFNWSSTDPLTFDAFIFMDNTV